MISEGGQTNTGKVENFPTVLNSKLNSKILQPIIAYTPQGPVVIEYTNQSVIESKTKYWIGKTVGNFAGSRNTGSTASLATSQEPSIAGSFTADNNNLNQESIVTDTTFTEDLNSCFCQWPKQSKLLPGIVKDFKLLLRTENYIVEGTLNTTLGSYLSEMEMDEIQADYEKQQGGMSSGGKLLPSSRYRLYKNNLREHSKDRCQEQTKSET